MFMNTYIHLLEASLVACIGLLVFQVLRYYKISVQAELQLANESNPYSLEANNSVSLSGNSTSVIRTPLKELLDDGQVLVNTPPMEDSIHKTNNTKTIKNSADSILNDYIGTFFTESPSIDIESYKISNVTQLDSTTCLKDTVKQSTSEPDQITREEDEVIEVVPILLNPVLLNSVVPDVVKTYQATENPSYNSIDDDSVIKVLPSETNSTLDGKDKVMSDKVVHAMLDEAKLVCVS